MKRPGYSTPPALRRAGAASPSDARTEDGYNTRRSELEERHAQDPEPGPGALQGRLRPEVAPADDRAARIHRRRDRGGALGVRRCRGLPPHGLAAFAPARALGGGGSLLDPRRGRQVPLQPRPALYPRHGDSPAHKDAVLELLSLGTLGDRRGGSAGPLGRLP